MSDILISGEIINEYLIHNKIIIAIEETRKNISMEQTSSPMFKGRPLRLGRGTADIGCHPHSIGNTSELIQSTHETHSDWKLHENLQWSCQTVWKRFFFDNQRLFRVIGTRVKKRFFGTPCIKFWWCVESIWFYMCLNISFKHEV